MVASKGTALFVLLVLSVVTSLKAPTSMLSRRKSTQICAGFGKSSKDNKQTDETPRKTALLQSISRKGDGKAAVLNHCATFDMNYPGLRLVHNDPPVFEIDNFFSVNSCNEYVQTAEMEGLKVQSQTFSSTAGSRRTSTTWYMKYDQMVELIYKANALTGIPVLNYEEPQIVRYEIGQQFTWHFDAIPKSMQTPSGNRIATLIVYLNDVDGGGATCFEDLKIQVKPEKGKALIFFPCYKVRFCPDEFEKWLYVGRLFCLSASEGQSQSHSHFSQ